MTIWVDFFEPQPFMILKSAHQDLSNDGSNFKKLVYELLKHDYFLANFSPISDKGKILSLLSLTQKIANVKTANAITFDMPRKVAS